MSIIPVAGYFPDELVSPFLLLFWVVSVGEVLLKVEGRKGRFSLGISAKASLLPSLPQRGNGDSRHLPRNRSGFPCGP